MNEKTETEEFDEDVDEVSADSEDQDLDRATRELESARRRGTSKSGMPALRQLELLREQKLTAELTSDFDDYDLDEPIQASAQRVRFR
jgi:hypothetical protein